MKLNMLFTILPGPLEHCKYEINAESSFLITVNFDISSSFIENLCWFSPAMLWDVWRDTSVTYGRAQDILDLEVQMGFPVC